MATSSSPWSSTSSSTFGWPSKSARLARSTRSTTPRSTRSNRRTRTPSYSTASRSGSALIVAVLLFDGMPERAPERAGDDAGFLRHAAFERALLPRRRRWARRLVHRRPLLLLQGLRHRRTREQVQDR